MSNVLAGIIAFAASIAAAALIYTSWRRKNAKAMATAGWLLAVASAFIWSRALGMEIGITYAIMVFVCLVWAAVGFTMEAAAAPTPSDQRPYQALRWPGLKVFCKHLLLFVLSVPGTGIITMMISVAVALALPWSMLARLAFAIFLYPVLWGGLSAWICAQDKLARPTLVSVGLLAVTGLILLS